MTAERAEMKARFFIKYGTIGTMKKKPRQRAISEKTEAAPIGKIFFVIMSAIILFFSLEIWAAHGRWEKYAPYASNPNCYFIDYDNGGRPFIVSDQLKTACFGNIPLFDFYYHDENVIPGMVRMEFSDYPARAIK